MSGIGHGTGIGVDGATAVAVKICPPTLAVAVIILLSTVAVKLTNSAAVKLYVRLKQGFVYLAVVMDVFTRAIRGWHLDRSLDQNLTLTGLQKALQHHCPDIHHSDQGLQYAAIDYTDLLKQNHVQISMAEVGEPAQNGYAERLMRTIQEEEVDLSEYQDYHDAYRQIGRFLEDVYICKRVHSSLNYLTPAEFETQWFSATLDSRGAL